MKIRDYGSEEAKKLPGKTPEEKYRERQTEANKRKLKNSWIEESTIKIINNFIPNKAGMRILCHGTRRGLEQQYFFKYYPGCYVIGTEISDNAIKYPLTIQWDFHDVREEWILSYDIIYSNSLDHSYNPVIALKAWLSCLKDGGILCLEWTGQNERDTWDDPFSATLEELRALIVSKEVGGKIIHIDNIPTESKKRKYQVILYIQNRSESK